MTFLATSCTLAAARATAVSAMTSALKDPNPAVTERLMKLSSTMSINSGTCKKIFLRSPPNQNLRIPTCPMLPQILAWMEGYISTSSMVSVISLSKMIATLVRLVSSGCLQNLNFCIEKIGGI
jgi:hypothetical protein